MNNIFDIAKKAKIDEKYLIPFGYDKAKIDLKIMDELKDRPNGKLVLVTAITPTKAGEGKTTTSIGLHDGLNLIGVPSMVALREPSLGPVFGIKGGATGGGKASVIPSEDINLHFTGDMHALTSSINLISAVIDNHIFQGNELGIDPERILWKRALDMNDRALRKVTVMQGEKKGKPRDDEFVITVASEMMAILCLANNPQDFQDRVNKIIVAYNFNGEPVTIKDLKISHAIMKLMKNALNPNLVQTLEGNPAIIHGGPFANIAHGCNSVLATKLALTYGDYVITEAGFGADLGAEKFYDIKCRKSGLQPSLTVLVAGSHGLKMHGGVPIDEIKLPNMEGLKKGVKNMDRHIRNIQSFGQTVIVCFNRYATDIDEEIDFLRQHCAELGVGFVVNNAFNEGGSGAIELANLVVDTIENNPSKPLCFAYEDGDSVEDKADAVACKVYGADGVTFSPAAKRMIEKINEMGISHYPICIAKTQYSFSADQKAYGVPTGFKINVRDIVINCGAEMLVLIAGDILRMPGLPKSPQAERIDLVNGEIEGLS